MGIGATLNNVGIVTNILPRTVYAIKINPNSFKVSTRKNYAELGIGVTFTSIGLGNAHEFEMVKKNEKCIISVDEVIQSPLTFTPIVYTLIDNSGVIGVGNTIINMSGISSIVSGDILKIDDEFMKVSAIGLGTQKIGPITGIGTYKLLGVERGFVGTSASSHLDGSLSRIYKGSFNIVGKTIHFTGSPKGSGLLDLNDSNLPKQTSTFNGRVFLRQKYDGNLIYDDISQKFNGIGQTFRLSISGVNTSGIQTGSGISLLNGIYQTPTTENNSGNNYLYNQSGGYSNIIYTGITSSDGTTITNVFDVNQNQLPRGGLIVSLGTTTGLGFAPLVGASVTAVVGAGGSIVSVGLGTTDRLGSGYNGLYGIGVSIRQVGHMGTSAIIQAKTGIGGTLSFNIVNGGTGYTPNSGSYGLFLPDISTILLNASALNDNTGNGGGINLQTNSGSDTFGANPTKLYQVISGSVAITAPDTAPFAFELNSQETLTSDFVFIRARNNEYNYTENPSFISGSTGEVIYPYFINNPQTYPTTVGLYNDSNDLLAVAKLSRPIQKDFTKEALIRVKLDF